MLFVVAAFRGRPGWRRLGPGLFGVACFLVAMEEISWGERILNVSAPAFFQNENLQGELTLHNLAGPADYNHHIVRTTVLFAFVWPVASRWIPWLQTLRRRFGIPSVPVELLPFFVVPVLIYYWYLSPRVLRIPYAFEIVELTLGIALAVLAGDVLRQTGSDRHAGQRAVAATVAILAGVWLLAAPLVFFFSNDAATKRELHKFTAHYFPGRVMPREALRVHDYFAQHPDMRSPETRFHEGILLIRLGREESGRLALELALREADQKRAAKPGVLRLASLAQEYLGQEEKARRTFAEAIREDNLRAATDHIFDRAQALASLGITHLAQRSRGKAETAFAAVDSLALTRGQRYRTNRWIDREQGRLREVHAVLGLESR